MISALERQEIIELVEEAKANGAKPEPACIIMGILIRTFQRWSSNVEPLIDKRGTCERKVPANKLTEAEEHKIIEIVNMPEYQDLPPSQIGGCVVTGQKFPLLRLYFTSL